MSRTRISGIVMAVFGMVIFFVVPFQADSPSSAAFPRIMSAGLTILAILSALMPRRAGGSSGVRLHDPVLLMYLAIILGMILVVRTVGFYPAIAVCLPLCLLLFGERNGLKIVLFSAVTTGTIYLILDVLLGSALP